MRLRLWARTKYHPLTGLPLRQFLTVRLCGAPQWFFGYQYAYPTLGIFIIPGVAIWIKWE